MPSGRSSSFGLTETLANFARIESSALPQRVLQEAVRAFTNWVGCVYGGCREEAAMRCGGALANSTVKPGASMIGQGRRGAVENAAFVNCVSSSALAFDDTHLATVTHPTGPVAAVLFALAETQKISGRELVEALAVGIEIQCRLSNALLLPPATANLALYITGVTGSIGSAAALGRVLQLNHEQMTSALGLAGAQSSGFRATHGSMAGSIVPAFAARSGFHAVTLAQAGITCSKDALEGRNGFLDVFANGADARIALAGLGDEFELFSNAYKPYPCGIVVHPAIDACLMAIAGGVTASQVDAVVLKVHPLAVSLADRAEPKSMLEAQVSLQHWCAITLLRGTAGVDECRMEALLDPSAVHLRRRVGIEASPDLRRDEAKLSLYLHDGTSLEFHVEHARGSMDRPMSDVELDKKFLLQATPIVAIESAKDLLSTCRHLIEIPDVSAALGVTMERTEISAKD